MSGSHYGEGLQQTSVVRQPAARRDCCSYQIPSYSMHRGCECNSQLILTTDLDSTADLWQTGKKEHKPSLSLLLSQIIQWVQNVKQQYKQTQLKTMKIQNKPEKWATSRMWKSVTNASQYIQYKQLILFLCQAIPFVFSTLSTTQSCNIRVFNNLAATK